MTKENNIPVLHLPPGEFVTPPDFANAMRVSSTTVRRWIRKKRLEARNLSKPGEKPIYGILATSAHEFYTNTFK